MAEVNGDPLNDREQARAFRRPLPDRPAGWVVAQAARTSTGRYGDQVRPAVGGLRGAGTLRCWRMMASTGCTTGVIPGTVRRLPATRRAQTASSGAKPNLGLFDIAGTRDNNVILTPEVAGGATHNFSPMLDRRPGIPESEQYRALGGEYMEGLTAFASADGVTWRKLSEEPVITKGAFDSQNVELLVGRGGPSTCVLSQGQYPLRASERLPGRRPRTSGPGPSL